MPHASHYTWTLVATALALLGTACVGELAFVDGDTERLSLTFGTEEDMKRAEQLWDAMADHTTWGSFPGMEDFQIGASPHGGHQKFHLNATAAANTSNFADGSIIVKRNYMAPDESSLAALTVMQKIPGYNPPEGDWFWVKFDPEGNVMPNDAGTPLAGKVGKGGTMGCIACHLSAPGGDLVFKNGPGGGSQGSPQDLMAAAALWSEMNGHESWPSFAGKEGWQTGNSPHGSWQTFHLNPAAARSRKSFSPGSIIIKRNFMAQDPNSLAAVTVMKKIPNFDPEIDDWFFAKFDPQGNVMSNPEGVPLAGAVGKGGSAGCVPCHTSAPGGDFVFVNPDVPAAGTAEDVSLARAVWAEMNGHESWPAIPGKEGIQPGNSPHGSFQTFHLNPVALRNTQTFGIGSMIIKRNFMDQSATQLGAVTVMKKIAGYNPDEGDWFWVKFDPTGNVLNNEAGVPLAGAVGKGGNMGCIACHQGAPGGDFVFIN